MLALKGNQSTLASGVEEAFIDADVKDYAGMESEFMETVEHGYVRIENRRYRTLGDLSGVPRSALWRGMNMVGMVESHAHSMPKPRAQRAFSSPASAPTRLVSRAPYAITGALRTNCIGLSTWLSARTIRACASPLPGRTWPCCATSH